jgi:hypothetical protein
MSLGQCPAFLSQWLLYIYITCFDIQKPVLHSVIALNTISRLTFSSRSVFSVSQETNFGFQMLIEVKQRTDS